MSRWLRRLILAGAVLGAAGCGAKGEASREKIVTPVRVRQVEEQSQLVGARYSGTVEPATRVDLAFKVGGYVRDLAMIKVGIISLIGVIVSHVIVLFDFIEERHEEGAPLREALLDAGILRLRPVLITVGATVFALVPLASHGGPLWEPLCYAQIGGLTIATFLTLLLVPVIYAIFVLDLKAVTWDPEES